MTEPRTFTREVGRAVGEDKFGKFRLTGGPCLYCRDNKPTICVHYTMLSLPSGIKAEDTILAAGGMKPEDSYLGVNCGCYARLHRQVAHIEDKMRSRS